MERPVECGGCDAPCLQPPAARLCPSYAPRRPPPLLLSRLIPLLGSRRSVWVAGVLSRPQSTGHSGAFFYESTGHFTPKKQSPWIEKCLDYQNMWRVGREMACILSQNSPNPPASMGGGAVPGTYTVRRAASHQSLREWHARCPPGQRGTGVDGIQRCS